MIHLHKNDLPSGVSLGNLVAIDTETMGLNPARDRLCLAQLCGGGGEVHIVQFEPGAYAAPNLKAMLVNPNVTKLFHFARFDIAVMMAYLGVMAGPLYCTKIASRLTRTFTDRHGLKDLARDLLGIELSKQQQTSDWGSSQLTPEQLDYAAADVLHLHAIKAKLDELLRREKRVELAEACFSFLPVRVALDLAGWADIDIFAH
ncbi:MAG: ribonuclease D [Proteobacteria bacterium]|nr:ribonuclease D [Pseudomonadota bacterium]